MSKYRFGWYLNNRNEVCCERWDESIAPSACKCLPEHSAVLTEIQWGWSMARLESKFKSIKPVKP